MREVLCSLLLILGLATHAHSASRIVAVFEYPRTLNASGFVLTITVEGQATPITMTVAASAVGACVAAGQPATPDTYCASFACFPPGSRLGVTVQAQVSTQLSGPSNLGGCIVDLQCNCVGIPGSGSPVDILTTPSTAPASPVSPVAPPMPVTASIPQPPVWAPLPTPPKAPVAAGPT